MGDDGTRGWWYRGPSRGAMAGLLTALVAAAVDTTVASGGQVELAGGELALLFVYAIGLIGLVTVPLGGALGAGLSALGDVRGWWRSLVDDTARDRLWARAILATVAGSALLLMVAAGSHWAIVHDLNNKVLASVFASLLVGASLPLAALAGAATWRAGPVVFDRLPVASLGRPWRTETAGLLAILVAGGVLTGVVGFALFYNPQVWAPLYLLQLTIAATGPVLIYLLLGASSRLKQIVSHPLVGLAAFGLAIGLAWLPMTGFETEDPVRIASLEETELEKRLMGFYMVAADRDGDGFSALLGGPDCDDGNSEINPNAFDIPGNEIDENCVGGDAAVVIREKRSTVPPALVRRAGRALIQGAAMGSNAPAPPPPPPTLNVEGYNLIVLVIDTLRPDHLGYMGYERETSPALDALAARSTVFERAYAHAPNTPRSVPSLFASRYPSEIAWRGKKFQNFPAIKEGVLTVWEVLEAAGYLNHGLMSHWYFRENRAMQQGFARWDNAGWVDIAPSNTDISTPRIMARFPGHLDELEAAEKPWSLFIHWADAHGQYRRHKEPVPQWGKELKDKYDQEIRFMDNHFAEMVAELETRGLMEKTVIVVTSDHGEAFREHKFYFHGQTIYEEILRVPLVVYLPGFTPQRIQHRVGLIDVAPTLLDAFGQAIPDEFTGESLVPMIESPESIATPRPIYAELLTSPSWEEEHRAWIQDDWKLIWKMHSGTFELYDLTEDPGEKKNRYRSEREMADRMKGALVTHIESHLRKP